MHMKSDDFCSIKGGGQVRIIHVTHFGIVLLATGNVVGGKAKLGAHIGAPLQKI